MINQRLRQIAKKAMFWRTRHAPLPINTSVKMFGLDWYVNERLVEIPFILHEVGDAVPPKRILEFGCTSSDVSIQLSALGHEVHAIDLKPYPFDHPALTFSQANILGYNTQGFDYVISISVLEHLGLGFYTNEPFKDELDRTIDILVASLRPKGRLIITVPCGRPDKDAFMRTFTPNEVYDLFVSHGLELVKERYYRREQFKYWFPCEANEIIHISNTREDRGPTGVNGVGCFIWQTG